MGGGILDVLSGGTAIGSVVSSGGTLQLFGGGTANGTTISPGGIEEIGSAYTLSGFTSDRRLTWAGGSMPSKKCDLGRFC